MLGLGGLAGGYDQPPVPAITLFSAPNPPGLQLPEIRREGDRLRHLAPVSTLSCRCHSAFCLFFFLNKAATCTY